MIETQKKKCPVCGEEFPYTDVRNVPNTCYKKMCQQNWKSYKNRMTTQGDSPDLKEMGIWAPSRDYVRSSEKSKTNK
jgi:hypothetical protein